MTGKSWECVCARDITYEKCWKHMEAIICTFFFFFWSSNKCFRIRCYSCAVLQILLFLLSGGGARHQTGDPKAPRDVYRVYWGVPPMRRIRAGGMQTKAANIQNFSFLMHNNLQSTGHWTNTQTKQTSTATSNSLPTVNKAEKGVAKQLVHHHPTTSSTTGRLVHHLILGHRPMTHSSIPCP